MELGLGEDVHKAGSVQGRSSDVAHRTERMIGYLLGGAWFGSDSMLNYHSLGMGSALLQPMLFGAAIPRSLDHVHLLSALPRKAINRAAPPVSTHDGSGVRNLLRRRSLYSYLHHQLGIALPFLAIRSFPLSL